MIIQKRCRTDLISGSDKESFNNFSYLQNLLKRYIFPFAAKMEGTTTQKMSYQPICVPQPQRPPWACKTPYEKPATRVSYFSAYCSRIPRMYIGLYRDSQSLKQILGFSHKARTDSFSGDSLTRSKIDLIRNDQCIL